jgi:hypothetical protein
MAPADDYAWRGTANPFPVGVASVTDRRRSAVPTIQTAAVREVDRLVDRYLDATQAGSDAVGAAGEQLAGAGSVIVVEGDYGTGKTQLAIEVLDRVGQARGPASARTVYRIAPGDSFLTLYTELMQKEITEDEILSRVLEFYSDIVADELRDRPLAGELVGLLEKGDVDPLLLVERFGLREGLLRERLREQLSGVTGDEDFSRALMLLMQPPLRAAVWRWLRGDTPDAILTEQGITGPIATDASALEALGVIALLYGRRNRRFVLIVDEMEKLVVTGERAPAARVQAFKKLLETFKAAGAMLVSSGLPDIFDVTPKETGRIDAFIRPSQLTSADVRWYIEETQARASRPGLAPFTEDGLTEIVRMSGGLAREVVRFCHRAYEQASATGQEITRAAIRDVARDLFPDRGPDLVRAEIEQVLRDDARRFERNRVIGTNCDFWIPAGAEGDGCAILVSGSVLDEAQAGRLTGQLAEIREPGRQREVILVVSGYLAATLRSGLADAFGGDSPVVYDPRQFEADLSAAVRAAVGRVSPDAGDAADPEAAPDIRALRAETERIGRQQSNTLRLVRELASQVMAVSVASDERLTGIQRALEAVPGLPAERPAGAPDALPPPLEEMLGAAERSLAAFGDIRQLLDDAFTAAASESGPGARYSVTYRLRRSETFAPLGVASFLASLITSFRESIAAWLAAVGSGPDREATPHQREQLREICSTYDALYSVAPLFQLDPLPELLDPAGDGQGELSRSGRGTRSATLQDAFDELGARVYRIAVELAGGAADPGRVAN